MLKNSDSRIILGIVFIIAVFSYGSFYFYTRWDYSRFVSELGETHSDQAMPTPDQAMPTPDQAMPTPLEKTANQNIDNQTESPSESKQAISEIAGNEIDQGASKPKFDAKSKPKFDAKSTLHGLESDTEYFSPEELAIMSPEVQAVLEKHNKIIESGDANIGEIIEVLEELISVLPEENEKRQQLGKLIKVYEAVQRFKSSSNASVEVFNAN